MDELRTELKNCLRQYRELDDQVRNVNKLAYDLREKRKIVELQMSDILKTPQLSQVNTLKLENDNSTIRILRPGAYYKPWSLSKKDLQNYIDHYFENAGQRANAKECFNFIVENQKDNSVEMEDFKFTRNIPSENVDSE